MIYGALRQFSDIHTHLKGVADSICSLPPKEAISMLGSDNNQYFSLELHPWFVVPKMIEDFLEASTLLEGNQHLVAIGECGIDANCNTDIDLQISAFEIALETAKRLHLPVVLHVVKSWEAVFASVEKIFGRRGAHSADAEGCRLIVHGFRKNENMARQLIDAGYYISLGEKYNENVVSAIPEDKIYHETDAMG